MKIMSARPYTAPAFIDAVSQRTKKPVLMIQTEGSCASSMRYADITGVPEEVRDELRHNDIAFVTFDTADEAIIAFDMLITNWPEIGQTTLSITAVLGVPGQPRRDFQQIPGVGRTYQIESDQDDLKMAA